MIANAIFNIHPGFNNKGGYRRYKFTLNSNSSLYSSIKANRR